MPANVRVERWVPQASVMPHARAMVSHGGTGTVRAGLAAAIPQVVLPLFADQPDNAARIDELGAGIALDQSRKGMAAAVRTVLADPLRRPAAAVAADIRALPPVARPRLACASWRRRYGKPHRQRRHTPVGSRPTCASATLSP